jgi:hypothetical protein
MKTNKTAIVLLLITLFLLSSCSSKGSELVGDWIDITDPTEKVQISKTNNEFTWEDNDGIYPAAYNNGTLTIETGFGQATAYYDKETRNIVTSFLGKQYRFCKSTEDIVVDKAPEESQGILIMDDTNASTEVNEQNASEVMNQGRHQATHLINKLIYEFEGGIYYGPGHSFYKEIKHGDSSANSNIQVYLERYHYNETEKYAVIEYKYVNPTDIWLSHQDIQPIKLSASLITAEGQEIGSGLLLNSENQHYPNLILPPKSYCYVTEYFSGINDLLEEIKVEYGKSTWHNEKTSVKSFNLKGLTEESPSILELPQLIEPKLDITELFTSIPFSNEYKDISKAEITSIVFNNSGGEIQLTITPDKYIRSYLLNNSFNYQLITNAGEVIQLDIIKIVGEEVDGQFQSKKPIVILLKMRQPILDKCNAARLNVVYAASSFIKKGGYIDSRYEDGATYDEVSKAFSLDSNFTDEQLSKSDDGNKGESKTDENINDNKLFNVDNCTITSSSNLSSNNKTIDYKPSNLIDGDVNTAWVEGVKGAGKGEYIMLQNEGEALISSISLINGYAKSYDLYIKNNRVKEIELEFSNGKVVNAQLEDGVIDFQTIDLDESIRTSYVKLLIVDTYPGSKFDDTCISEILIR